MTQDAQRGKVARLPARESRTDKVLDRSTQRVYVAFMREHGQGETQGKPGKWRECGLGVASCAVPNRQHDFVIARGVGWE